MTDTALFARKPRLSEAVIEAARANLPLAAMTVIYFLIAVAVSFGFGFDLRFEYYGGIIGFVIVTLTATLALCSIYAVVRNLPERPIPFLAHKWITDWQIPKRLLYGTPVVILFPLLAITYTGMKSWIPAIIPFYADPWAAWLDHRIHGQDAWMLLHAIFGTPIAVRILDVLYLLWFPVLKLSLVIAAFSTSNIRLRSQFLLGFVLCWALLGSALATLLSSVGPRYYFEFYGEDRFHDLFAFLTYVDETYPLAALEIQERLLEPAFGSPVGYISALPSLHVAIAGLIAIAAWSFNRWLGTLVWAFAFVIFVGSVQLGWHYAIDGYVSLLLLPPIWYFAGWISKLTVPQEAR